MNRNVYRRGMLGAGLFLLSGLLSACLIAQPPAPKGKDKEKRGPIDAEYRTAEGAVREFTSAPKGETDGLILSDGTWVHWPPHLQDRFAAVAKKGDRVKAGGFVENDPATGKEVLEASVLTNVRTSKSAENPDRPAPVKATPTGNGDMEQRIKALEDKVDDLTAEVRRLKNRK